MAARHHRTMEAGGWILLAAAIAWLIYLLFHKDGQAALTGQAQQPTGSLSLRITEPPPAPSDPTQASTYVDSSGQMYVWNVVGKQWHVSGGPAQLSQGAFFV